MTQRGVEVVLGKLVSDEAARERFERAPETLLEHLVREGIELNHVEFEALAKLDAEQLRRFAATLDRRLCKVNLAAATEGDVEP